MSRQFSNDVFLQVGLLTVVGLSAKNAILIIEFAKERQDAGHSLYDSVTVAARQRLRPIIMTSLAFGIGVVPLFLATGAGSGSQNAIGTSVLGGVISATMLGVFFIPMFYVWIRSLFKGKDKPNNPSPTAPSAGDSDGDNQPSTTQTTVYAPTGQSTLNLANPNNHSTTYNA